MSNLPDNSEVKLACFSDFYPGNRRDRAENMARAINAYVDYGFNWRAVYENKVVCRRTLQLFLEDQRFLQKVREFDRLKEQYAESILFQALDEAPWSDKIRASDRILGATNPQRWDLGVRRERERTKGNAINELFKQSLSESVKTAVATNAPADISAELGGVIDDKGKDSA